MKKKNITFITKNQLCFSCGACGLACKTKAISFYITNAGRLHPRINYDACINCGVCYDICPAADNADYLLDTCENDPFKGRVINSYFGRTLNSKIFNNAQSGGMVTEVLSYLFDTQRIKYALVVKMNRAITPTPSYFLAKNSTELYESQKSIYTPINLLSALKDINDDIAIVGLPCHLEGIISLSRYEPKKFAIIKYKLGLICNGVLSYLASDYISSRTGEKHKIIFRDKQNPNYIQADITLEIENCLKKSFPQALRFKLKDMMTPPRCLLCFDKMNIFADIVFGDPWGIDGYDKIRGDSIVITRNKHGHKIIEILMANKRVKLQKIDYILILNGQKIEEKKKIVTQAYETYKRNGYATPRYFQKLNLIPLDNQSDMIGNKIEEFLEMEERTRIENLKIINKIIKWAKLIEKIKLLLKRLISVE